MCYEYEGEIYNSDVSRIINKFDIYTSDIGELFQRVPGIIDKYRSWVILSSDDNNCPTSSNYMAAPIRTVHNVPVTDENVEQIVADNLKKGKIYVPIKMFNDGVCYRFIDITQMRTIPARNLINYKGTVLNPDLRKRINAAIMQLYFNHDEFISNSSKRNVISEEDKMVALKLKEIETFINKEEEIIEVNSIEEEIEEKPKKKRGRKSSGFPMGFSKYYQLYQTEKMSAIRIADKCGIPHGSIHRKLKEYGRLHPELNKH